MSWWKLCALCGIGFFILFVVSIVIQGSIPSYDDSIEDIRAYYADHGQSLLTADYLLGFASILLFIPFLTGLSHFLRLAEGPGPQLCGRMALLGGYLIIVLAAAASVFGAALAFGAIDELDDGTVRAFMYLDYVGFNSLPFAFALLVGATSLVIVMENVLWPWLGLVGYIVAPLSALAPLGFLSYSMSGVFDYLGFFSFAAFLIWVLLISISLWTRDEEPNVV